jgi:hypothetical protein
MVNLTCDRNPRKQASIKDRDFLRTMLQSGELNDILGMILKGNPEDRITVDQLEHSI